MYGMPRIPAFQTRAELVQALKGSRWRTWFHETRCEALELPEVVRKAVRANTFRYFRGLPVAPSVVFRSWAEQSFTSRVIAQLNSIESQAELDTLLQALSVSLRREWVRMMTKDMKLGPSIKLPSLLLKRLCASPLITEGGYDVLTPLLHVPLDSFTLGTIRTIHNNSDHGLHCQIPLGAGMGWVDKWREYRCVQATIKECATEAGVPAIAFDILAWDQRH
jgi:hypothetical protein